MRSLAAFALRGRLQAALAVMGVMALAVVLPPAGLLSLAIIALVTLRHGAWSGVEMIAVAALFGAAVGWVTVGNPWAAAVYAVVLWLPVWGMALVLRERIDLSLAIQFATAFGVVAVLGFFAWNSQPTEFWQGALNTMFAAMLDAAPTPEDAGALRDSLSKAASFMTGLVVAGLVTTLIMAVFLARWWQAALFNPGGFGNEYLAIHAPRALSLLVFALMAGGFLADGVLAGICRNVLVVATVLYLCVGVSALHGLCARLRWRKALLILLYALVFVVPQVILPIALIGVTDAWANWRHLKPADPA